VCERFGQMSLTREILYQAENHVTRQVTCGSVAP
jgi:hypothetical protein